MTRAAGYSPLDNHILIMVLLSGAYCNKPRSSFLPRHRMPTKHAILCATDLRRRAIFICVPINIMHRAGNIDRAQSGATSSCPAQRGTRP